MVQAPYQLLEFGL